MAHASGTDKQPSLGMPGGQLVQAPAAPGGIGALDHTSSHSLRTY